MSAVFSEFQSLHHKVEKTEVVGTIIGLHEMMYPE